MDGILKINPFVIKGYYSKELFCDREDELQILINNVRSGADTTLISDRRLGKTGLVYRLFDEIGSLGLPIIPIAVDLYPTTSLASFIQTLSEAVMRQYPQKTPLGRKFLNFIKGLRPVLSTDPVTGEMKLSVTFQSQDEKQRTLEGILEFLNGQDKRVLIALDEFQQIRDYPETRMEAVLRTLNQRLTNLTFIFSGSGKHLMADIFSNAKSPFYASTRFLWLEKIPEDKYARFISEKFSERNIVIPDEIIRIILKWTLRHTFYTQSVCSQLYELRKKRINVDDLQDVCLNILKANELTYLQYKMLLTPKQWTFLIAIAKKEEICSFQSISFLQDSGIPSAATSRRIAQALIEKGLLTTDFRQGGEATYRVCDVFFMRWLQMTY